MYGYIDKNKDTIYKKVCKSANAAVEATFQKIETDLLKDFQNIIWLVSRPRRSSASPILTI